MPLISVHLLEGFAWCLAYRVMSSLHVIESSPVRKTLQTSKKEKRNPLCKAATPRRLEREDRRTGVALIRPSISQQGSSACLSVTTATTQLQPLTVRATQTKKKRERKKKTNVRLREGKSRGEQKRLLLGRKWSSRTKKRNRTVQYVAHAPWLQRVERINGNQQA